MVFSGIIKNIISKSSFLCIGLDTDIERIPKHLLKYEDPVFEFNKQIVDATNKFAIAYKPNTAFYETNGSVGWKALEKTVKYIRTKYPEMFLIADAKRGDIGNTSKMYAKAFFHTLDFDAITVAPYMGEDSVKPFLEYNEKWVILLALTSNIGSQDFQFQQLVMSNKSMYEKVVTTAQKWGTRENLMFVVGATKTSFMTDIRKLAPEYFWLVPGVGAQGGSLNEVATYGMNDTCGLLVNSSREIIYAGNKADFAHQAALKAEEIAIQMKELIKHIEK